MCRKKCKHCFKFISKEKSFCNEVCENLAKEKKILSKIENGKTKCVKCGGFGRVYDTKYLDENTVQRWLECTSCQYKYTKKYDVKFLSARKKIIPKKCPNCKNYFVKEKQYATDRAITCSRSCIKELWAKIKYERYKRKCLNCNKVFSKRRQIYCSKECSAAASAKNMGWTPKGNYIYKCVVCLRNFAKKRSNRNKIKTCSAGCKHISSKGYPSYLWKKFQDVQYRKKYIHINRLLKGYKLRNIERWNVSSNLTTQYLIDILPKNNKCPILGYDLHYGATKKMENKLSLDRIDNEKGYVKENVMWMSQKANMFKNNLNKNELYKFCVFWLDYNMTKQTNLGEKTLLSKQLSLFN